MDKKKTLKKRVLRFEDMPIVKIKKDASITPFNPRDILLDKKVIGGALLECLEKDNTKRMLEIIKDYIKIKNESEMSKEKFKSVKKTIAPIIKSKKVIIKKPTKNNYSPSIEKRAQKKK